MSSNPKNIARKRVQERVEISWKSRKFKLVNLQCNPNDQNWGKFGCTKRYCYINLYSSDDSWTPGDVSWGLLRHFLGILDCFLDHFWWKYWYFTSGPLNQSRVKYQYLHQKTSRKLTNISRKLVRRSRKPVWGSREHVTRHKEGLYWPRKCMNKTYFYGCG